MRNQASGKICAWEGQEGNAQLAENEWEPNLGCESGTKRRHPCSSSSSSGEVDVRREQNRGRREGASKRLVGREFELL